MGSVMTAPSPAWPLQTRLPLAALPTAPSVARGHVRAVAREWGLADLADIAELLVSELVTNAVQASARLRTVGSPVVHLWVTSDRVSMVIHVWDASGEMPVRRDADEEDEDGGRGLLLVETLGKDWGAYRKAEGKVVWCLIAAEP
jgi:anti-sigma regulatory factor (Ser/Thr protein kinase)